MAALGLVLGVGGAVLTASLGQAEDDGGVRAFHRQEAARQAMRAAPAAAYTAASAYAPAIRLRDLPLVQTHADGRIAHPRVELNPFKRRQTEPARTRKRVAAIRYDAAAGAAKVLRTVCVRLCDGSHAPIGQLHNKADIETHRALCSAANPGVPVKLFTLAPGVDAIEGAVASDGTRYRSLPMAFAYEREVDPTCRPAQAGAAGRGLSALRDITLRPGDSIVLDGKVRTFTGGQWPYTEADFRDFRVAKLSAEQRRAIDDKVGISQREAQLRSLRRSMAPREAAWHDPNFASDAVGLRGMLDAREPVRIVLSTPYRSQ
jgi:hypothetical protein